jgi:hypothetical protein
VTRAVERALGLGAFVDSRSKQQMPPCRGAGLSCDAHHWVAGEAANPPLNTEPSRWFLCRAADCQRHTVRTKKSRSAWKRAGLSGTKKGFVE